MTIETGAAAPAQTPAANDEAVKTASATAAKASKDRIAAILNHEESKGRETLARHIAFDTDMSVDAAVAMLKASAKEAKDGGSRLGAAMDQIGNANIDGGAPGASGAGKKAPATVDAKAIYAKRAAAMGQGRVH